ncbi:hypothetical protein [Streptomyces albogriseolus]|uniref:hypothetical protein n=1 Tax=Streptomyces albogriseolus TaxID=1887 RepID=UPI00346124FB
MDSSPDTPFEALFGQPAPQADVRVEPIVIESAGKHCDFCPMAVASTSPVTWAYPAKEAVRTVTVGATGHTMDFPIAAGLWYACGGCHRYIKANAWARLAVLQGFPDGHSGPSEWQMFRTARLPGPGHAWPLNEAKLPPLHKDIERAWPRVVTGFTGDARRILDQARPLLLVDSRLYFRVAAAAHVDEIAELAGERLGAALTVATGRTITLSVLPPAG